MIVFVHLNNKSFQIFEKRQISQNFSKFLNVEKTKYTLFHKKSVRDNIPLKLPDLKIANNSIERTTSIKFLGVMIDENITWEDHIHTIEKKLAKNLGLLYQAKHILDNESLKTIYFHICSRT